LKIFGLRLFEKKNEVQDKVPDIEVSIPDTKKPAMIKRINNPTLGYQSSRVIGRGAFEQAEYNLAEIGRVEDTDSYVRQAFDKKVALMFKEGWDITGKNLRTIKYLKMRFAQISRATGVPTRSLMRDIGSGLIRKSNAFLIKVRKTESSGGRLRREPGANVDLKPIAGYFVAPAETMSFKMGSGNKITRWRQRMPSGDYKDFSPKDVVHFHYDRKEGFIFGTPVLTPVVDDVRALRKIEENVELLVYAHLFPMFQYVVGTKESPAGMTEDGRREIDVVKQEIEFMPTEGGIVTPFRHEIRVIGAENQALRAEGYLEHFKKRVFAGLAISAVDMGEGETANRATADNMSRNLIDAVKDFQQVAETFVNEFVLNELLLESTFGDDVLNDDNVCFLKFKEIDVDAQIKKDAHHADQFNKDVITHDEARRASGYEPLQIPSRKEIESEQDTAELYPEWHRTRWKLFEEPTLIIQSLDEPWTPTARAVARSSSLETTQGDIDESGKQKQEAEIAVEKERTKAKVAVAKAKPKPNTNTRPSKPKRKDGYLKATYEQLANDLVLRTAMEARFNEDWTAQLIRTAMDTSIQRLIAEQVMAFRQGFNSVSFSYLENQPQTVSVARNRFSTRANHYVARLVNHVISALKKRTRELTSSEELAEQVRAVFDAFNYRTDFIEDVEIRKAFTWGQVVAWRAKEVKEVESTAGAPLTVCEDCKRHNGSVRLKNLTLETVPPYHAHCYCSLEPLSGIEDSIRDSERSLPPPPPGTPMSDEPADVPLPDTGGIEKCPKCDKTALLKTGTADLYNCPACKHSWQKEEKTEDAGELGGPKSKRARWLKCVQKAKARLRTQNPKWDEGTVKMHAETACDHLLQDEDEEG